jgi:hypothetical protein
VRVAAHCIDADLGGFVAVEVLIFAGTGLVELSSTTITYIISDLRHAGQIVAPNLAPTELIRRTGFHGMQERPIDTATYPLFTSLSTPWGGPEVLVSGPIFSRIGQFES